MVKFNRRYLLRAGLTVGALATTTQAAAQIGGEKNLVAAPRQRVSQSSEMPASHLEKLPDRAIATLLIQCCELAVFQHQKYLESSAYQGAIRQLDQYSSGFDRYTQIASFQTLSLPPQQQSLFHGVALKPSEQLAIAGRREHFGLALTSTTHHVIALQASALPTPPFHPHAYPALTHLVDWDSRQPQLGQVQTQLQQIHQQLVPQIQAAVQQFEPALPCYVTGYSLGGAIAPLVALQIAQHFPALRPQIQVYTYGAPPVGDRTFAQVYNSLLPNTHGIVNLADLVPSQPAATQPIGQTWTYLTQRGTLGLNHAIETYKTAVMAASEVS
ncbi:MAG TPA: lipase family protein [Coleofasciculaceae cyanobacterium]